MVLAERLAAGFGLCPTPLVPIPARYRDPLVGMDVLPEPGLAGADVQNGRRVGHFRIAGLQRVKNLSVLRDRGCGRPGLSNTSPGPGAQGP
jgi:hypothetical protein